VKILNSIVLPESCEEVNLELDSRNGTPETWSVSGSLVNICQQIALRRSDGSQLEFECESAVQYTWTDNSVPWEPNMSAEVEEEMKYNTTRICWRAKVARRKYMSHDLLDCLRVQDDQNVTIDRIISLQYSEGSGDSGSPSM
jgi:hypothetical protein